MCQYVHACVRECVCGGGGRGGVSIVCLGVNLVWGCCVVCRGMVWRDVGLCMGVNLEWGHTQGQAGLSS